MLLSVRLGRLPRVRHRAEQKHPALGAASGSTPSTNQTAMLLFPLGFISLRPSLTPFALKIFATMFIGRCAIGDGDLFCKPGKVKFDGAVEARRWLFHYRC
jgi:hypothetical protein